MDVSRRLVLRVAAVGTATPLAGCSRLDGSTDTNVDGNANGAGAVESVGLETLVDGLRAPLDLTFAPDADRRYVAEQQGIVHAHEAAGLREDPFLDLRDAVTVGGERGLLGLALHPDFASTRRLFVRYSAPPRNGTPSGYSHTFVLSEFTATADGRRVDPDSERTILEIPEPQGNHNAGDVAFGPDGLLYVAVGDGGAGGDQGTGHVEDWYDAVAGGNGQDVTGNLLGGILRIDVDGDATETPRTGGAAADSGERAYDVPADNPLVGRAGLDEHYAWGFRNPYRMSFDGEDLFVGDVGQNRYEEVDLIEKGGNYGWNVKEGTHCYGADECPDATPEDVRGGEQLVDPIVEYPHTGAAVSGISVIGGYVYRGSAIPELEGEYVFGDLQARGRLFVASRPDDGGTWPTRVLDVTQSDARKLETVLSFGQDAAGAVYVLGTGSNGGGVYRVVPAGG